MSVLSLFNGYGGLDIAIGSVHGNHYASEVDKACIEISTLKNPGTINLGDVTKWRDWDIDWSSIDLLVAGSPCQGFSDAGKGLNFDDPRSKLFFEFVDIRNHILSLNPNLKWLLENVKMKKDWTNKISEIVGVHPLRIDARLISPCGRDRNYWFNWNADVPEDKGLTTFNSVSDEFKYPANIVGRRVCPETGRKNDSDRSLPLNQYLMSYQHGKARCVTTVSKDCLLTNKEPGMYKDAYLNYKEGVDYRKPTIKELCEWHGIPSDYFDSVTENKARKMIGNGWNINVIKHILKFMK